MADYLQNLNSLASTSSLSQIKLDAAGHLAKRSLLETLGHRIKDAFRSLSAEGRAAITARSGDLLSAMQKAVDESRGHEVFIVREAGERLRTTLGRLQGQVNKASYFSQIQASILNDLRFSSLPALSQTALRQALVNMTDEGMGARPSEWKSVAASLKWAFFGEQPAGLDLVHGTRLFSESLKEGFLNPKQQTKIKEGFHQLTITDFKRGAIRQVGGTPTPPGMDADFYQNTLSQILGDEHRDLMPFVSTIITQNGIGTLSQQLPRDSGHNVYGHLSFCSTGLFRQNDNVTIRREGDALIVQARFDYGFRTTGDDAIRNQPAFLQQSTVTMRIDLAATPERHEVNSREVLIPQFTLENVTTGFSTEDLQNTELRRYGTLLA